MKHRAYSLTALLLALLTVASCGGTGSSTDTTAPDSMEDTTTAVTNPIDELVIRDFGGVDFNILSWDHSQMSATEENGDIINDAVFRRNKKVEEMFNVNINIDNSIAVRNQGKYAEWWQTIMNSILAGDNTYDLAGGYGHRFASDSMTGYFKNLCEIDSIDLTKPWWAQKIMSNATIGDNLYMAIGCADPLYWDATYVMYCNKRLAEIYKVDDLYTLVREGKWTLDKLMEYSARASSDLDGDGVMGENDQYGLIVGIANHIDAFIPAFDIKITTTENKLPKLMGLTEKFVDAQKKLSDFVHKDDVWYKSGYLKLYFMNGQALFLTESIWVSHIMREMDDDFNILPYPKYDEEQENYGTYVCIDDVTGFSIPITADAEKSGCILSALTAYGYEDIRPEYYERALKGKVARDEESTEMLDIIFDNVTDDFTHFYAYCFGNEKSPWMLMRTSTYNETELSSAWAADESLVNAKMEELISLLK